MRPLRHAVTWGAVYALSQSLGGVGRLALVAWLLGPEATGAFAVALGIATALGAVVESGVRQQFIASPAGISQSALVSRLQALWKLQVVLRAALFIVSLALIALPETFSELAALIPVLLLSLLIQAAGNPSLWRLERQADFKLLALIDAFSQFLAISLLLVWRVTDVEFEGSAVLATATLAHSAASTAMSWVCCRRLQWVKPRPGSLRKLFSDGAPYRRLAVLTFCTYGLDRVVIGSLLGTTTAGVFFTAIRVADAPMALSPIVNRALLPGLSEAFLRGSDQWRAVTRCSLCVSAAIGIFLVGVSAVAVVLVETQDAEWRSVLRLLPILFAAVSFRLLCQVLQPALIAQGRIDVDAKLKFQEVIVYVPVLLIAVLVAGAPGAATAYLALYLASFLRRLPTVLRALP